MYAQLLFKMTSSPIHRDKMDTEHINLSKYEHGLGILLSSLMEECDIDDATLSRETGIPASTISRMRLNPDANPTASTLRPIAKFFGISISQLLGDEPLPKDRLPGTHHPSSFTSSIMPVIDWSWVIGWVNHDDALFKDKLTHWISTEKMVGSKTFALIVPTDLFGLAFRKGSIIIIDPDKPAHDGDLVLLRMQNERNILLRQFLKDGNDTYIRSVNPEMKGIKLLTGDYQFLGVVIETRFSLESASGSALHQESDSIKTAYLKPILST